MSAYSGRQYRGARKAFKQLKREEAEARNLVTKPERRKAARAKDDAKPKGSNEPG